MGRKPQKTSTTKPKALEPEMWTEESSSGLLYTKKPTKEKTKAHIWHLQPAERAIFQMSSAQNGLFAALNLFNNIKQEHLTI